MCLSWSCGSAEEVGIVAAENTDREGRIAHTPAPWAMAKAPGGVDMKVVTSNRWPMPPRTLAGCGPVGMLIDRVDASMLQSTINVHQLAAASDDRPVDPNTFGTGRPACTARSEISAHAKPHGSHHR